MYALQFVVTIPTYLNGSKTGAIAVLPKEQVASRRANPGVELTPNNPCRVTGKLHR